MKVTPVKKKFGSYPLGSSFEFPDAAARVFIKAGILAEFLGEDISPRTGRPKRQYRRRDMTPE